MSTDPTYFNPPMPQSSTSVVGIVVKVVIGCVAVLVGAPIFLAVCIGFISAFSDPSVSETFVDSGRSALEEKQYDVALKAFDDAINAADVTATVKARALAGKAEAAYAKQDYANAEMYAGEAMVTDELAARVEAHMLVVRAEARHRRGAFGEMMDDAERLLSMETLTDKGRARALFFRAEGHWATDSKEQALSDYQLAFDLAESEPDLQSMIQYNRSVTYGLIGKEQRERADLEAVIERGTANNNILASAYLNLGVSRAAHDDDMDSAIEHWLQAVSFEDVSNRVMRQALINLSDSYSTQGHHDEALAMARRIFELPDAGPADKVHGHYTLGIALYNSGSTEQASEEFAKGRELAVSAGMPEMVERIDEVITQVTRLSTGDMTT